MRYYYLLLLTPAWSWLWPTAERAKLRPYAGLASWLIALVPLASKSTEVYVAITVITYVASVAKVLASPTSTGSNRLSMSSVI
ncbi:MAG TPA: hypothetical protein EYP98_06655 [Planctomycetes bacterium]|nr:hypothetical protein [Planctomycetota bacterium]